MGSAKITISVVSHRQAQLVALLLGDLARYEKRIEKVVLTINIPEPLPFQINEFPFPIALIENRHPKGFGANHNQAYSQTSSDYFCVLNPDIRLERDPFPALVACLQDEKVGAVAPKIVNRDGQVEDSARRFPTPGRILRKCLRRGRIEPDYNFDEEVGYPEWIGGMFMLFRSNLFGQVMGFDERYFLYYEDVDLCARLQLQDYRIALCSQAIAIHDARRQSHRDIKYLRWHLLSMLKFFFSTVFIRTLWASR